MKTSVFSQIFGSRRHSAAILLALLASCSNLQVVDAPPLPPKMAPALDLPHPMGFGVQELKALFLSAGAPERGGLAKCSADIETLVAKTQLREEIRDGARELVLEDPTRMHWCFYERLLTLEEGLRAATDLQTRQGLALTTYRMAVPVARAFQLEFKDSRYLRWAIQRYRAMSPSIFYRKVELTPEATMEMAVLENAFGAWKTEPTPQTVLTKYGIRAPVERAPAAVAPVAAPAPAPAAAAAPAVAPKAAAPAASPEASDEEISRIFQEIETQ